MLVVGLTWFAHCLLGVAKGVGGGAIIAKEKRLDEENIQLIVSSTTVYECANQGQCDL